MKIPRGIVEDVLVQVNYFYFTVEFVVLDTELATKGSTMFQSFLGRPFLANTTNALINCRNGFMHIIFGDMTLELTIFNTMKKLSLGKEENDVEDAYLIDTIVQDHVDDSLSSKLEEFFEQPTTLGEEDPPDPPIT